MLGTGTGVGARGRVGVSLSFPLFRAVLFLLAFPVTGVELLGSFLEIGVSFGFLAEVGERILNPIRKSLIVEIIEDLLRITEFGCERVKLDVILKDFTILLYLQGIEIGSDFRLSVDNPKVVLKFLDKIDLAIKPVWFIIKIRF